MLEHRNSSTGPAPPTLLPHPPGFDPDPYLEAPVLNNRANLLTLTISFTVSTLMTSIGGPLTALPTDPYPAHC